MKRMKKFLSLLCAGLVLCGSFGGLGVQASEPAESSENITQVRDLTRDLEKSEQKLERSEEELVDVRKELQYYKKELAQSQRENQQLKQQIYNLQHPQQSWDEPER